MDEIPRNTPMRLTRPRFTVRRLMLAVAVVAVALGWIHEVKTSPVSERLWKTARQNGETAKAATNAIELRHKVIQQENFSPEELRSIRADLVWLQKIAAHHRAMERKYRIASFFPWVPVSPDPPPPEYP